MECTDMNENIQHLNNEFKRIRKIGWIESMQKGSGGIGYTFEKLLGKNRDTFFLPDFNGIEIKTKHLFSKGNITLFSLTPDGDYLFPIEYLRKKYGYHDKIFKEQKVFNYSVCNADCKPFNHHLFKLRIDYKNEKVVLCIKNLYDLSIDSSISWSFSSIKSHLYNKLSYLAIVKAINKYSNEKEYLHYYDIKFYKLKTL